MFYKNNLIFVIIKLQFALGLFDMDKIANFFGATVNIHNR